MSARLVVGRVSFEHELEPRSIPTTAPGAVVQAGTAFRCDTPQCGQVLARIGTTGGIYPQVTGAYYERRRIVIPRCPGCGRKIRIPIPDD